MLLAPLVDMELGSQYGFELFDATGSRPSVTLAAEGNIGGPSWQRLAP